MLIGVVIFCEGGHEVRAGDRVCVCVFKQYPAPCSCMCACVYDMLATRQPILHNLVEKRTSAGPHGALCMVAKLG